MCINPFDIIAFNISIVVIYYVKNKVKKTLAHKLLQTSQHLAYITNLYHLQTHSKIILLTFLILTPEHNDSHNVKTNYSDSEKLLHNFK